MWIDFSQSSTKEEFLETQFFNHLVLIILDTMSEVF